MKKRILIMLITVFGIAFLYLIGHIFFILQNQDDLKPSPTEDAVSTYTNAISKIDPSEDMILSIHLTEEMTVDGSVFLEISDRIVSYDMQTSGSPSIQVIEKRRSGTHDIDITETFINDTVYLTVNETPFKGNCDAQQYTSFLIPAIIISSDLYRNIESTYSENGYLITFSDPISGELWLTNPSTTLLEARGVARISNDGTLETSMYTASYQINGITFRVTAQVDIQQENVNITPPDDAAVYTPIGAWQAPKQLERACGYLLQAKQISAAYVDSIYFEAIGDRRDKSVASYASFDTEWSVSVETDITTLNKTKQDQAQVQRRSEIFIDGQYRVSNNSEVPVVNESITVDTVYNYFQDQLVSTIMLPQHIQTAESNENEDILRIIFAGTDTLGYFLAENACQLLYNDPNLITETGSGFTTKELNSYLDIDKTTGLPLASGIDFTGSYTTEGLPYLLKYRADQTYIIPNHESKAIIQKAADN